MGVPVTIVEWEPGVALPLHELSAEMYEIPQVGDPYWRGNVAMRVRQIEEDDRPRVHLERDPDRERTLLKPLPAGLTIDCGRDSDSGIWHAAVYAGSGNIVGHGRSEDPDSAVAEAVADARERTPPAP